MWFILSLQAFTGTECFCKDRLMCAAWFPISQTNRFQVNRYDTKSRATPTELFDFSLSRNQWSNSTSTLHQVSNSTVDANASAANWGPRVRLSFNITVSYKQNKRRKKKKHRRTRTLNHFIQIWSKFTSIVVPKSTSHLLLLRSHLSENWPRCYCPLRALWQKAIFKSPWNDLLLDLWKAPPAECALKEKSG